MTVHLEEHLTYKKIFHAAYAPILMMIFSSLYTIVDGIFVSNFAGADAFAGLNLVFPFYSILGSVGFMFGAGGSALVSKTLGEKNKARANGLFSMVIYFSFTLGIVLGIAGFFSVEPFVFWMASLSKNGASEFVSNISSAIVGSCYNAQLLLYLGQDGVAAYGIVMYVSFIFMAIFIGYATSMAPFIGYHYGAGNKNELRSILRKSFLLIGITGLVMFGLCQALAEPLSGLLSSGSQELKSIATNANRIYAFVYLTAGFTIFMSSYFTSLNNGTVSAVISFFRSASELACVFLVPLWLNVNGIWSSACFAEISSTSMMLFFLFFEKRRYGY